MADFADIGGDDPRPHPPAAPSLPPPFPPPSRPAPVQLHAKPTYSRAMWWWIAGGVVATIAALVLIAIYVPARTTDEDAEATPPTFVVAGVTDGVKVIAVGWTMFAGRTWVHTTIAATEEAWQVSEPADDLQPVVAVATEKATGMSLSAYLTASMRTTRNVLPDVFYDDSGIVTRDDGTRYALLRYRFAKDGHDFVALAYIVKIDGGFAIATLVGPPSTFDEVRDEIAPYLATLASF